MELIPGEGARGVKSIEEAREALCALGYAPTWAILNKDPKVGEGWRYPELGEVFSIDFMQGTRDNVGYYMPALESVALTVFNGKPRLYAIGYTPEDRIDFEDKPK